MKLITVNRSVRRLSTQAVEGMADAKGGVYARAAVKEAARRARKHTRASSRSTVA